MTLRLRRAAAWLALASLTLSAAWPLLANAKPSVPALPSEICSATGLSHAAGGTPASPPDKDFHVSHCTLCPFGAERCAAIPYAGQLLLPSFPAVAPISARSDAPRPGTTLRAAAPARAPPLLSRA
jgi:Protein of unknown function (DUF2946)